MNIVKSVNKSPFSTVIYFFLVIIAKMISQRLEELTNKTDDRLRLMSEILRGTVNYPVVVIFKRKTMTFNFKFYRHRGLFRHFQFE